MTDENQRLIREGYDAINRGDVDWLRSHTHPDLEFRSRFSGLAGRSYRGKRGFEQWLADTRDAWEEMQQVPERLIELDEERTIADVRFRGRGKSSGAVVEQRLAVVFTIRDGQTLRMDAYDSVEDALEATSASD